MTAESIDKAVDKCLNSFYEKGYLQKVIKESFNKQQNYRVTDDTLQLVSNVAGAMLNLSSDLLRAVLKELL